MRRKQTNKRKKRQNRGGNAPPPSKLIYYRGPTKTPQEALVVMDLLADFVVTTSAGGVINAIFGDVPSSSPDWTNVQALFSEYRVLSMTVKFVPNLTGATQGALVYAPLYSVWDAADTITPLASYAGATNYSTLKVHSLIEHSTMMHKMSSIEEANYGPTAAVVNDYAFKYYSTGLTVLTTYGRFLGIWHIECRGRV